MFDFNDIKIELPKYIFVPGDIVSGKVITSIGGSIKATSITLKFYGQMIQRRKRTTVVGGQTCTDHYDDCTFFSEHNIILAGEGVYDSMEYPFSFQIPLDIYPENTTSPSIDIPGIPPWANTGIDILIDVATKSNIPGASILGGASYRFFLEARIDIPWAIDVTRKQEITIHRLLPHTDTPPTEPNI